MATPTLLSLTDDALVGRFARAAFGYFQEFVNPSNGLVADTSRSGSPCSIAVVGFALTCYPIAVENGWMSRRDAIHITTTTLRFFLDSVQSDAADATGYRGFYYHFLDMHSGTRVWKCELSLVDTALLLAGVLTAQQYFAGDGTEQTIRALAQQLYDRVDFAWAQNDARTLAQGWKPECGFLHYGWEGYNEANLLYVLALGSSTHPPTAQAFCDWTATYQWEHVLHQNILVSGPLFTHYFSQAWIDFRDIHDEFMRGTDNDYYRNTQRTIAVHREYADRNPRGFVGYCRNFWGITAGEGPDGVGNDAHGTPFTLYGYMSRGAPYGPDDGTISPWAMLAALPFERDVAMAGIRHALACYPQICPNDRFVSGFNPSITVDGQPWISPGWFGLDQGITLLLLENARSELIWRLLRGSPIIREGLQRAGFEGGWLNS
jgi:hypothetical protein